MQAIQNFLSGFADSVIHFFDLVIGLFRDFFQLLRILCKLPSILTNVFSWLPAEILSAVLLLLGCVIMYKILGREG